MDGIGGMSAIFAGKDVQLHWRDDRLYEQLIVYYCMQIL